MRNVIGAGALAAGVMLMVVTVSAQRQLRRVFVNVVDEQGAPVLDMRPGDFELREGGVAREVASASLGTGPVRVALMVDSSDETASSIIDLRAALIAFADALPSEHEILFITMGRQMRIRVQATTDRVRLKRAMSEFASDGGGTVLLDSVREVTDRFMRQPEVRWPVFVIITGDGPERSGPTQDDVYARMVQGLIVRGSVVHAIAMQSHGGNLATEVAMNLTGNTGGYYTTSVVTGNILPAEMQKIAQRIVSDHAQMATKYQLDFYSDAKMALGDVNVAVVRSGLNVQASLRRPF